MSLKLLMGYTLIFQMVINVSYSKSIVHHGSCGTITVQSHSDNKIITASLEESKIKSLIKEHWQITSMSVISGMLFRLCSLNICKTFSDMDAEIPEKLRDIDIKTVSAKCFRVKAQVEENVSCSQLSPKLEKGGECARFYRSARCKGILPYEIAQENGVGITGDVFESVAIKENCHVLLWQHHDNFEKLLCHNHNDTLQNNLLPAFSELHYPHKIHYKCNCGAEVGLTICYEKSAQK